jgi:histone deacetylase 11
MTISRIAEMQVLATIPASVLDEQILKPMRLGTGGTLLASQIALEKGVAINLSGGYHHAKPHEGDGFCFYADVPCAIQQLRKTNPNLEILIIDLDAHQGNGNAVCCKDDPLTEILDIYNQDIFPQDKTVKGLIKWDHPISGDIPESEYLSLLDYTLTNVLSEYSPDLIIYNAGTDILAGDPLGQFSISAEGICTRDLLVFQQAKEQQIPLAMVLSGGYTKESSKVIGESILNLCNKLEGF